MGVSKNRGTPKSSILIGFSIIFTIHFGVPLFLETPIYKLSFAQIYDTLCKKLEILQDSTGFPRISSHRVTA